MRIFFAIASMLLAAVFVCSPSDVRADTSETYTVEYDPLYAGLGSQGGLPLPQSPNPLLFFEEKVHWPSLRISEPRTAWEYAQRGIYRQDDLGDLDGAKADYHQSETMNNRIVIVQARLGVIALYENRPDEAIEHLDHVLEEVPFHEGVHLRLGKAYELKHAMDNDNSHLVKADESFQNELKLSPNSQMAHFARAKLLAPFVLNGTCSQVFGAGLDCRQAAVDSLDVYLRQARWHSDPEPYRILKARRMCVQLQGTVPAEPGCQ